MGDVVKNDIITQVTKNPLTEKPKIKNLGHKR